MLAAIDLTAYLTDPMVLAMIGIVAALGFVNRKEIWTKAKAILPDKIVSSSVDRRPSMFEAYCLVQDGMIARGASKDALAAIEKALPYCTMKEPTVEKDGE